MESSWVEFCLIFRAACALERAIEKRRQYKWMRVKYSTHTEADVLAYLIAVLSFTSTLWFSHSLPPVRPNGTEESTCLSTACCISLHCLSPYLSLPTLYSPSIPPAINLSPIPLSWIPDLAESFALHYTAAWSWESVHAVRSALS